MEEHFDEYEHYNFQFDKQIFSGENCQNFEKIVKGRAVKFQDKVNIGTISQQNILDSCKKWKEGI